MRKTAKDRRTAMASNKKEKKKYKLEAEMSGRNNETKQLIFSIWFFRHVFSLSYSPLALRGQDEAGGSDEEAGRDIRMTFTKKSSKINRPGELRPGHSFRHTDKNRRTGILQSVKIQSVHVDL